MPVPIVVDDVDTPEPSVQGHRSVPELKVRSRTESANDIHITDARTADDDDPDNTDAGPTHTTALVTSVKLAI